MKKHFLLAALISSATVLHAAAWKNLGTDAHGVTAYFDGSSFRKAGALRYYTMKYSMPAADTSGMVYTIRNEVIDCDAHTVKTLNISGYRADDTLIATVTVDEPARQAMAGSDASEMVEGVCSF